MSTASASCRNVPSGPCPSETYSVHSTMAALSWARRRPTSGCPSTGRPISASSIVWPRGIPSTTALAASWMGLPAPQEPRVSAWLAAVSCLRRLLERDPDPRGRQTHPRSPAQPQPPGYRAVESGRRWSLVAAWGVVGKLRPGVVGTGCAGSQNTSLAALVTGDGRYVLNGNWAASPPGTYEAAGTHVVYIRAPGPEETLHAAGPTSQDLLLQVLLQEPNPGVQFEFWLPRERYGPFQARAQTLGWALRQPQPREVEPRPPDPPPAARAAVPTRAPTLVPDPCPPCPDTRGRAHRLLHYCGSDFVFQARVLSRHHQAQETQYEVRILLIYKNRSPLRTREYVWAPGYCPCPPLAPHREYLLAVRRLVSPDGTQDRLLLPHAGYARPWSPAEDSRARLASRRCPL
ncbi:ADAMTS-like protein 5 isoform X3 [Perognathus longimembris pacificus]|nr:ADAMTS-like protein 5 isoform X3 [Perognathus longimembris pacificus]